MKLSCEFYMRSAGYRCIVKKIKPNDSNDVEVKGHHEEGRSNRNVQHLEIINIELTKIPRGLGSTFACTKVLWIQSCNLDQISQEDFAGFESLQSLSLKNNLISELSDGVFDNCRKLTYLSLQNNLLKYVEPKTFERLKKLKSLNLQYNTNINAVWKFTSDAVRQIAMAEIALKCSRVPANQISKPALVQAVAIMIDQKPSGSSMENVQPPVPKEFDEYSIFIRNIAFNVSERELGSFFNRCGTIKLIDIARYKSGHSKGFAFIEFQSKESVKRALEMKDTLLKGRYMNIHKKK
jgi:Leucine-rich repeat (LRR) protein